MHNVVEFVRGLGWWNIPIGLLALAVTVLLFPSPFARLLSRKRITSPIAIPPDVTLRVFPRWLLWSIGQFRKSGPPGATTFATCIYVNLRSWVRTSDWQRRQLVEHELVHVRQSRELGVRYLPVYLWLLFKHGYEKHPMEIEADGGSA